MAASLMRAGVKSLQSFTVKSRSPALIASTSGAVKQHACRLDVDVQRWLCRVHAHPVWLKRSCIHVTPVALLHTGHVTATHCSLPITVTEEQDTLLQKMTVLVKGHDKAVLDSYELFANLAAKELGLFLIKVFEPPRNIERLTLLKSVHIFKKHRVQYEMRTYYRCIEIGRITGSTAHAYIEYIQRNLPEGVAMEITKTAIEKLPQHIQTPMWGKESQHEQASQ